MKLLQLIIFVISGLIFTVHAQEPIAIHLTEEDGLPDVEYYSMLEDSEGYIWFASSKGLSSYDGKEFKKYTHPNKKGRSVFNLQLDSKGRVWCNNIAGQLFYVENGRLILYDNFEKVLTKRELPQYAFFDSKLLMKDSRQILVFDTATKQLTQTIKNVATTGIGISLKNEFLYLEEDHWVAVLNTEGKTEKFPIKSKGDLQFQSKFYRLTEDEVLISLIDTRINISQLVMVNRSAKQATKMMLPKELSNLRIEDVVTINKQIYLATSKGVFLIHIAGNRIQVDKRFLQNHFVTALISDKNKNIWISTLRNGVYVIPNRNIQRYRTAPLNVAILEKQNDSISLLGTRTGKIFALNANSGKLTYLGVDCKSIFRGLDYNTKTKQLFVTTDKTWFIWNLVNKKRTYFKNMGSVKSISLITDNTYLLSTHIATIVKTSKYYPITNVRSYKSIYSRINDKIYVAEIEGAKVFDRDYKKEQDIMFRGKPIYAFDIAETANGTIWFATYNNGILGVKNNEVISHLKNILTSTDVNVMAADGDNLWIATSNSLGRYNTITKKMQLLTAHDGITSFKIKQIEVLADKILFLSNLGVFGFDKKEVFKEKPAPDVYISNVLIGEEPVGIKQKYFLKPHKNDIEINFNVKNFRSVKHTVYEYKLNDESEWITVKDGVDFIKFISLPVGEFQFQLRAKNKFAPNYSKTIKIDIEVLTPFYRTWWFLSLMSVLVIALLIVYFQLQTKKLKEKQEKELKEERLSRALVLSQLENLRSQMNPHFIFNALNSIQDYIVLNEKKLARKFLVKFSRLIRIYLEHSQQQKVSLEAEVKALDLYLTLEQDRFHDSLHYTIEVAEDISPSAVFVPSLFIQPYVENAIKHGLLHKETNRALSVKFSLTNSGSVLLCVIEDNGIGRSASETIKRRANLPKSFATAANQKRIDLLNSTSVRKIEIEIIDKRDDRNEPTGTVVVIKIPIE